MQSALELSAIGHMAHAALVASGGRLDDGGGFAASSYARAGGEILWIGHGNVPMHPRVAVLARPARLSSTDRLAVGALTAWRPPRVPVGKTTAIALRSGCALLAGNLPRLPKPKGLATLLVGDEPAFPLDRAREKVRALALALAAGDCASARTAALPLLGLGPGLTPSGDDLVGGAWFAQRMKAASAQQGKQAAEVGAQLIADARQRSHPIAAALFADCVIGATFAPLHRLARAMATQSGAGELIAAASSVVAIGHSSGWDMLAGFMIGIAGVAVLPQPQDRI